MYRLFYVLKINCQENAPPNIKPCPAQNMWLAVIFLLSREVFVSFLGHRNVCVSTGGQRALYFSLLGTVMTPNYIDSSSLSVAPWCDCRNSGNDLEDCLKFLNFFKDNTCLSEFLKKYDECRFICALLFEWKFCLLCPSFPSLSLSFPWWLVDASFGTHSKEPHKWWIRCCQGCDTKGLWRQESQITKSVLCVKEYLYPQIKFWSWQQLRVHSQVLKTW